MLHWVKASGAVASVLVCAAILVSLIGNPALAENLTRNAVAKLVEPPYQLGQKTGPGAWELLNLDGRLAGYGFETLPLAPLPGFSGAPINLFVSITLEGRFIDAEIISHNEPIFVSGLGEKSFHNFVSQYKGHSISDTLVVGVPYGKKDLGSSLVYLDGVTKATASVRIAHESILGAAFAVARDKLGQTSTRQNVRPDPDYEESLTWTDLVVHGIAARRLVTNAEADAAFAGSLWEDDDPEARENPKASYLDLWVIDLGPPTIAKAVLSDEAFAELQNFLEISNHDQPILVIDAGRHGLVGEDFIRNTSPGLILANQDGLPIALRDSDLEVELAKGVPGNTAMILRTDRRLGFDPTREWELTIRAVRKHGSFRPEIGTVDFSLTHLTDERFYLIERPPEPLPPWRQAIRQRAADIAGVTLGLGALFLVLLKRMSWLAGHKYYTAIRLAILAIVAGFIGWWGQGQLSIATVLGVIRSLTEGGSLLFLLYDPVSLVLWIAVLLSFVIWGRGLFCGWLCPFGAIQEFAHHAGRFLKVPQLRVPAALDRSLVKLKYLILAMMVAAVFGPPSWNDVLIEIEPFKTVITTFFVREWYFIAYAVALLLVSMVVFKGFCRYLCPLGAFMAIGGLLRRHDWIERRPECGSPCQLCKVRCNYNAISDSGAIRYDECFQCLDCVTIYDDPEQCVPRILAHKGRALQ